MQLRLAEAQDNDPDHGKEEEGVLAESVESEEGAKVAEEDIEGGEDGREEEGVYGAV